MTSHAKMTKTAVRKVEVAARKVERERQAKQRFMARTGNVYRHQTERLRKLSGQADAKLPFSLDDFREWFQAGLDRGCYYTGAPLKLRTAAVDHRRPLKRGGDWGMQNLALCTDSANFQKGGLTEAEFKSLLDFLAGYPPEAARDVRQRMGAGAKMLRMRF